MTSGNTTGNNTTVDATTGGDTTRRRSPVGTRLRHLLSTATLATLYVLFAYAHVVDLIDGGFRLSLALIVLFESVMVALVFFRRPAGDTDLSPLAVTAGLVGSFAVLGLRPVADGQDLLIGQILQVGGAILQLGSSASIRRSFGVVPANRGIQTTGLYRLVRHPFYMSYLVHQIGYLISNSSLWNTAVVAVTLVFQIIRIRYEERLLMRDRQYVAYTQSVRRRLIPGLW